MYGKTSPPQIQSVGVPHALQMKLANVEAEIASLKAMVLPRHTGRGSASASIDTPWSFTAEALDTMDVNGVSLFDNQDLFDTLNEEALKQMVRPPANYDAQYTANVNKTLITALMTLLNQIHEVYPV
jgi:hypothetical protein